MFDIIGFLLQYVWTLVVVYWQTIGAMLLFALALPICLRDLIKFYRFCFGRKSMPEFDYGELGGPPTNTRAHEPPHGGIREKKVDNVQ